MNRLWLTGSDLNMEDSVSAQLNGGRGWAAFARKMSGFVSLHLSGGLFYGDGDSE